MFVGAELPPYGTPWNFSLALTRQVTETRL